MKRIIITGASGFVGQNLQHYLREFHKIKCLSARYVPNQKFILKGDVVIHLAGKAHDLKNVSDSTEYYEANFELTKQLFDGFLESEANLFIFMSTVKAVADKVDGILTEATTPDPKTHYGLSKQKAEQYILSQNLSPGKRVYILRPCMIHGPGNKGNLNLLYRLVSTRLPWPLGDFSNKRSFLSIENLCFVIKTILEIKEIPPGIYHIADNEFLSTNDLIKIIGESLNKKPRIINIPSMYFKNISIIGDYLRLPLNSERLEKLTENYVVSNAKILSAIGKDLPIGTEAGLLRTFNSFKMKKDEF